MIKYFKSTEREPSDLLSPILIKELRQGMRGRVFLGSFLLLQLAMVFCAAGGLVSASLKMTESFEFFSGLFWVIIGLPLILIIPGTGAKALRSEIDNKSLELICLTHLTPWRIVAGKWAALFAQGLLFVSAVLPYLVLRYFLGGIDLVNELVILFTLLLACALLTGMTVGSSATGKRQAGAGLIIFYVVVGQIAAAAMFSGMPIFPTSFTAGWAQNPLLLMTIFAPLLLLLLLEAGTNKISPPAEPRSLPLRGLGFLFLLVAALLELAGSQGLALKFASLPLFMIAIAALTETPRWIRSVYTPYVRRGIAGQIVGRFLLYPGWPSGIFYVIILALFYGALAKYIDPAESLTPLLLVLAILLFPVAVTRIIARDTAKGFAWFFSIQIIQLALSFLGTFLHNSTASGSEIILVVFPTTQALVLTWNLYPAWSADLFTPVTAIVLGASLLVLFVRAWPLLPLIKRMETDSIRPVVRQPQTAEA